MLYISKSLGCKYTCICKLVRKNVRNPDAREINFLGKFKKRPTSYEIRRFPGADSQIRTGDLILTKDALYLLSYISKFYAPYKKGHSGDREGT